MTREEYDRIRDENSAPDNELAAEREAELLEWNNLLYHHAQEELDDVDSEWYEDEFNYEEDNHDSA